MTSQAVLEKEARPLLDYALRPNLTTPESPDPWIVSKLLAMGADPTAGLGGASIWGHYLLYLSRIECGDHQTNLSIISKLLHRSANKRVAKSELKAAWSELKESPGSRFVRTGRLRSSCDPKTSTIHKSSRVDDSDSLDVLDLLSSGLLDQETKTWIMKPFSDDDMTRLEDMLKQPSGHRGFCTDT
jgi:hypothetical protein